MVILGEIRASSSATTIGAGEAQRAPELDWRKAIEFVRHNHPIGTQEAQRTVRHGERGFKGTDPAAARVSTGYHPRASGDHSHE